MFKLKDYRLKQMINSVVQNSCCFKLKAEYLNVEAKANVTNDH